MLAVAASLDAAARDGALAVPPGAAVDRAPAAQPSAAACGRSSPSSSPAIRPASKQSPAPVASTGVTGGRLTWYRAGPSAHSAPRSPSLTTTRRPAPASAETALSRSSAPARRVASASFGSSRPACAIAADKSRPAHRPDGSQLVSRDVDTPAERAAENNAPSPGPRQSRSRNHELACTCRAPASSDSGTSAAVSEATAPSAVKMARSPPRDSATVIPVGASWRTATKRTSPPSAANWSRMNAPAGSAPTAATSATRSPSRAAATAVIAAEPPMTSEIPSTSFSCWPKAGSTSVPRTSTSGLQSPRITRSWSGGDNVYPGVLQPGRVLGGDPGVGDQHVDLGRGADPGEGALPDLGAVRDDDDLAGLPSHQPVDAGLALVVRGRSGHRVDPVHAQDGHVQRDLLQHAGGQRAGQLVGLRPGHPAGGHDLDVLPDGQFGRDVQRVGDHGERGRGSSRAQIRTGGQGPRHLRRRGAPVEPRDLAGPDHAGGQRPDALLLGRMPLGLVTQRQVVVHPLGHRTAADPGQHLLAGQLVKVPADGRRGNVQRLGRVLHLELAPRGQQLEQLVPPAITAHRSLPPARPAPQAPSTPSNRATSGAIASRPAEPYLLGSTTAGSADR